MNPKASVSMSISSVESYSQRVNQKRLLHSDSSVSYQGTQLAPNLGEESIKEILSRVNSINEEAESTTSRSFVHGLILVAIMITSLIAFLSSKVRRCSSYIEVSSYEDCSAYFHFYSAMTISSCLVTFLIYFLHLIAQCDILCLTRKKYECEILAIAIICSTLMLSAVCYMAHTNIFAEYFTLASLILSGVSILLYLVRIVILTCEMLSQRRRLAKQTSQSVRDFLTHRSISKDQSAPLALTSESALPSTKVISYVRGSQRTKTLSTSVSDELDDDVFIQ